ncbi:hypothetical protein GE21DRAFT_1969 [Neurospora crassa]|uniref:Uncharacterized protein n=1 Tax=Neurospora crassa (strain ATCC 24698 / 74-OR23-1A / CBS 708.71 / DSM 1257 / FGSC 987) TaxID=367110 RepID=Q7SED3_NEUCR|nr:hypothetical protein NCU00745 [Neurospora crassa OR74A]EAA35162.1 hypothetical protein NCU00745 [Neurospora crassa OR74A]KHE89698.1 hypothetical protein GE21DRAFT_1969 [Neurospora crassa]|eukprot:XP_964398.1 hypothetical protein NCU00745 [Neurospora crassa OR74A]
MSGQASSSNINNSTNSYSSSPSSNNSTSSNSINYSAYKDTYGSANGNTPMDRYKEQSRYDEGWNSHHVTSGGSGGGYGGGYGKK